MGERAFQAEETACAKAQGQHHAWCIGGTVRRSVWLEQSKRGEEREDVGSGKGHG